MTALALALLAIPFLFGLARLVTTASDWRYLAVAIASTLGTTIVLRRRNRAAGIARRLVAPFVSAVFLATMAALAVGARSGTSIAVVAIGFAFCSATGAALLVRARGASRGVG
jgi:hypothetical protein